MVAVAAIAATTVAVVTTTAAECSKKEKGLVTAPFFLIPLKPHKSNRAYFHRVFVIKQEIAFTSPTRDFRFLFSIFRIF